MEETSRSVLTRAIINCRALLSLPLTARTAYAQTAGPFFVMYTILFQYVIVFAAQFIIFAFMAHGVKFINNSLGMLKEFQVSTIVKGMFAGCIVGMFIYGLFGEYLYDHVYRLYTHPSNRYWYFHLILSGCLISAFCSFLGALIARDFARK